MSEAMPLAAWELIEDHLRKGIPKSPLEYRSDEHSVRAENHRLSGHLETYVRTKYPRASFEPHLYDLLYRKPPAVARTVIENYLLSEAEKMDLLVAVYKRQESVVTQTLGMRGRRKTITTWDLVHEVHKATRRPVYSTAEEGKIPEFATPVIRIEDAPAGCIIVEDELAAEKAARNHASADQKNTPAFFGTLRQREQHYFGIIQNTATGDNSVPLFADVVIVKPLSLLQLPTERPGIRKMLETWDELLPREDWEALVLSVYLHPLAWERPIPTWWQPDFSKSYSAIPTLSGALKRATELRLGQLSWSSIASRMASRGWPRPAAWWEGAVCNYNGGLDPAPTRRVPRKKAKAEGGAPAAKAGGSATTA